MFRKYFFSSAIIVVSCLIFLISIVSVGGKRSSISGAESQILVGKDGDVPFSRKPLSEQKEPTLISELIGKPARVYHTGGFLTQDYSPDRVNIELSKENTIVRIWFG